MSGPFHSSLNRCFVLCLRSTTPALRIIFGWTTRIRRIFYTQPVLLHLTFITTQLICYVSTCPCFHQRSLEIAVVEVDPSRGVRELAAPMKIIGLYIYNTLAYKFIMATSYGVIGRGGRLKDRGGDIISLCIGSLMGY